MRKGGLDLIGNIVSGTGVRCILSPSWQDLLTWVHHCTSDVADSGPSRLIAEAFSRARGPNVPLP